MIIHKSYEELFSLDNIFLAWRRYRKGKAEKYDIKCFERNLEDNIFSLYKDLSERNYRHSVYKHFVVFDNKKRDIFKADVRDRIIHQIIYEYLTQIYKSEFISDSYSSIKGKGVHRAIKSLKYFIKLSGNKDLLKQKSFYYLKCDIKKYFDNVDHSVLYKILEETIQDNKILGIIKEIIFSFKNGYTENKGIPLGNVTSQVFANIYLNSIDHHIKEVLKVRFYIRYNDDFIILDNNSERLERNLSLIRNFLAEKLFLDIPQNKTTIQKINNGVEFLGQIIFPTHSLLRVNTKVKLFKNIKRENIHSKIALLKHCDGYHLYLKLLSKYYFKYKEF